MSLEKDRQFNLASEKSSDKMSEKMSEFIKSPIGKFAVGMLVVISLGIATKIYLDRDKTDNDVTNTPPQQEQITSPTSEAVVNSSNNSASSEQVNTPEATEGSPSIESQPTESVEKIPTVEELEIDASLMSDPEKLLSEFVEKGLTMWDMQGATPENSAAAIAAYPSGIDVETFARRIAEDRSNNYIEALLPKDWRSNESLKLFVERSIYSNGSTLAQYYITEAEKDGAEKKAYTREHKIDKIVNVRKSNNGESITIQYVGYVDDNEEFNRVGEDLTGFDKSYKEPVKPTMTFTNIEGKVKLTHIIFGKEVEQ